MAAAREAEGDQEGEEEREEEEEEEDENAADSYGNDQKKEIVNQAGE